MRVEQSKQKHSDKKETSNFKTEKSVFDSAAKNKTANASDTAQPGAFAKILEEARRQTGEDKKPEKSANGALDAADQASESEDKKETDRRLEREKNLEKRHGGDRGQQDGGDRQNGENNSAALAANALSSGTNSPAETNAPPARSILHVADLERIVSTVRAQNFADAKQVLIALKHSVLDGLQIKLSLVENGNLKAEFLAANRQIKKQLKKREGELGEILKQRSARFTDIEIIAPFED